jgi:hypothetical protein
MKYLKLNKAKELYNSICKNLGGKVKYGDAIDILFILSWDKDFNLIQSGEKIKNTFNELATFLSNLEYAALSKDTNTIENPLYNHFRYEDVFSEIKFKLIKDNELGSGKAINKDNSEVSEYINIKSFFLNLNLDFYKDIRNDKDFFIEEGEGKFGNSADIENEPSVSIKYLSTKFINKITSDFLEINFFRNK